MNPDVKGWMSGDPISVAPDAAVLEAHDRMVDSGIRHLPVVDADNLVVGVLSLDDLRAALPVTLSARAPLGIADRELARELTVGEVMTHSPETAHEDASLGDAADRMADHRIGCLPVVDDDGRLLGMFTETDALRALATSLWSEKISEERAVAGEHEILADQLRAEQRRIAVRLEALQGVERELSATVHDQPMDAPESSADLREVRIAEKLDALAVRRLAAIDRALDNAEQGRLGVCDDCGGRIPVPRLRAMPGTTLCVACARAGEKGEPAPLVFERPPGGRAETGRPELGSQVYTRFGEGVLLRVTPFGSCRRCGDMEGFADAERDEVVCGNEGCSQALTDVVERAIVAIADREAYVDPADLRSVDLQPYD